MQCLKFNIDNLSSIYGCKGNNPYAYNREPILYFIFLEN